MEGEDEATKVDARQFMTDVLPTNGDNVVADGSVVGVADMRAWKSTYATAITAIATAAVVAENNTDDDAADATATTTTAATDSERLMETFWSTYYNPETTSIWTMKYDEVDSTDDLKEAIGIVDTFMMNPGMILEKEDATNSKSNLTMKEYCFGVMHTYDNLDIEGLWFFNGLDPEELFGANEETSWYTWTQVGPEANEHVKNVVANYLTPDKKKVDDNNRAIKDTKVFC